MRHGELALECLTLARHWHDVAQVCEEEFHQGPSDVLTTRTMEGWPDDQAPGETGRVMSTPDGGCRGSEATAPAPAC